ncbi:MAG: hypothetical protein JKX78_09395 [Alteromonadaceae bacterium]|nr:hypothetical protein [Alteromonadaceae bacterium]
MYNWIAIAIIVIAFVSIIGNFSTFQKNSKQKLRPKGLNDLKETLPRTHKSEHKMPTMTNTDDK